MRVSWIWISILILAACGGPAASAPSPAAPPPPTIDAETTSRLAWFPASAHTIFCSRNPNIPLPEECITGVHATRMCGSAIEFAPTQAVVWFATVDAPSLRACIVNHFHDPASEFAAEEDGEQVHISSDEGTQTFWIPNSGDAIALLGPETTVAEIGPGRTTSLLDNSELAALVANVSDEAGWIASTEDIIGPFIGVPSTDMHSTMPSPSAAPRPIHATIHFADAEAASRAAEAINAHNFAAPLREIMSDATIDAHASQTKVDVTIDGLQMP